MNRKERLTRCYFGLEVDRPAVYSRTAFPLNDTTYDRLKGYLREFSELKGSFIARNLLEPFLFETRSEPYSEEFKKTTKILHTPKGDLQSIIMDGLGGRPGYIYQHFIKDEIDCEKYLSLPMPKTIGNCLDFFKQQDEMGEKGIIHAGLGSNPAGAVAELMGSETFAILSITGRELIHEMCRREMNIILQMLSVLFNAGVGPFFSMEGEEYIVPPLHGKQDFYDFNVQYDKPIVEAIHNANGRIHIHCHGRLSQVLSGFLDIGTDVLHPIEAPPMGDVTALQARAILKDNVCIEGNIQIASMYEKTPGQIREETKALIHDAFTNGKGLIISPTASPFIPGSGEMCFEQYKAMIDTVINQ